MDNFLVDRIISTEMVRASDLLAHPDNFRIHNVLQSQLVDQSLSQVGWVRHILVNRPTGLIVDGHLRLSLVMGKSGPDSLVPVDFVELSEDEERAILAVLDESSTLVFIDEEKRLTVLAMLQNSKSIDPAVVEFLEGVIAERSSMFAPLSEVSPKGDKTSSISKQEPFSENPSQVVKSFKFSEADKLFFYETLDIAKQQYSLATLGDALIKIMRLWNDSL